jgi:hypothetical protein
MEGQVHVGERASSQRPICPYCHSEIVPDEGSVWTCPKCETRHHDGCASENGGCTLLGCGARHEGRSVHWPDAHRPAVALEPEALAPASITLERSILRGGGAIAALGAGLCFLGALLELPGPSREIAIHRAQPVISAGAAVFGLGLAVVVLAFLFGLLARAWRSRT